MAASRWDKWRRRIASYERNEHMCIALPGRIEDVSGEDIGRIGRVDFGGITREVNLALVPEAAPGDWVLVHAGIAINTVDEAEARRVLEDLEAVLGPPEDKPDEA